MSDLIKRLRRLDKTWPATKMGGEVNILLEAADEIERLESRVAELGAALQHFYDYGYDRGRCEQALGGDDE